MSQGKPSLLGRGRKRTQCHLPPNSTIPPVFMCTGTQRSLVHECRQFTKGFPTPSRGQTSPIRLCRGLDCAADGARGSSCQAGSLGQTKAQPRSCGTRPVGVGLQRREAPTPARVSGFAPPKLGLVPAFWSPRREAWGG